MTSLGSFYVLQKYLDMKISRSICHQLILKIPKTNVIIQAYQLLYQQHSLSQLMLSIDMDMDDATVHNFSIIADASIPCAKYHFPLYREVPCYVIPTLFCIALL